MGRQMGFDGYWSQLEAWIDHTGLWRPDGYLAHWHCARRTFWRFGVEKPHGCMMGGHLYIWTLHWNAHGYTGVLYTRLAGE